MALFFYCAWAVYALVFGSPPPHEAFCVPLRCVYLLDEIPGGRLNVPC